MKRIVTGFLSLILLTGLFVNANAQELSRAYLNSKRMAHASAASHSTASGVSQVFLDPGTSGMITLTAPIHVDSVSYFEDTTSGNWWLDGYNFDEPQHVNAPGDTAYDSIGNIAVNLGGSAPVDIYDTEYNRLMGERFTTPTDITALSAKIDSVSLTFVPLAMGPNDSLVVWIVPMVDEELSQGGVPIGAYPFPSLFASFARGYIPASAMTMGQLNTLTAVFAKGGVSLVRRAEFGVIAIVSGPNFPTDTLAYQFDANISPTLGASLIIDTDGTQNPPSNPTGNIVPMRTYLGQLDAGNVVYNGQAVGVIGGFEQFWGFDLPTSSDPTQAFEGNMVAVAYLHGSASGVTNDPTSTNILGTNYPNPVSTTTDISYNLELSGPVTMNVYNALGQNVSTVVNAVQGAGQHTVTFNAGTLPDGIYYYKIQSGEFTATNSMVIAR